MPTINEMIDLCEDMAAHDCFSNEQFARRDMFYAIADELKKQNNIEKMVKRIVHERFQKMLTTNITCPYCGKKYTIYGLMNWPEEGKADE